MAGFEADDDVARTSAAVLRRDRVICGVCDEKHAFRAVLR